MYKKINISPMKKEAIFFKETYDNNDCTLFIIYFNLCNHNNIRKQI